MTTSTPRPDVTRSTYEIRLFVGQDRLRVKHTHRDGGIDTCAAFVAPSEGMLDGAAFEREQFASCVGGAGRRVEAAAAASSHWSDPGVERHDLAGGERAIGELLDLGDGRAMGESGRPGLEDVAAVEAGALCSEPGRPDELGRGLYFGLYTRLCSPIAAVQQPVQSIRVESEGAGLRAPTTVQ